MTAWPSPASTASSGPTCRSTAAASTAALPAVADRVTEFLPWYSSVHRGAGYKSQMATAAYEEARAAALRFAGRTGPDDVAIICRNTTEAINHLAYRLRLGPDDVVVTTVVEHHANLLPWARHGRTAPLRRVRRQTARSAVDDVVAALDAGPGPQLLAITGATNVTGWLPPIDEIIDAAHDRGVPVLVDAAQLAPHRPMPAGADFLAWSGHKMYAPFGAGVLDRAPRRRSPTATRSWPAAARSTWSTWTRWCGPIRPSGRRPGSPNVIGAVALGAAIDELDGIGWDGDHRPRATSSAARLRAGPGGDRRASGSSVRPLDVPTLRRGHLRGRRRPPRPGGGPAVRRVRHRRAPRLLLRPPLPDPPARARRPTRSSRYRARRAGRRPHAASPARCGPAPASRSTAGRDRPVPRRRRASSPTAAPPPVDLPPGPGHRRLLARGRRRPRGRPATVRSAPPAPGADPLPPHLPSFLQPGPPQGAICRNDPQAIRIRSGSPTAPPVVPATRPTTGRDLQERPTSPPDPVGSARHTSVVPATRPATGRVQERPEASRRV